MKISIEYQMENLPQGTQDFLNRFIKNVMEILNGDIKLEIQERFFRNPIWIHVVFKKNPEKEYLDSIEIKDEYGKNGYFDFTIIFDVNRYSGMNNMQYIYDLLNILILIDIYNTYARHYLHRNNKKILDLYQIDSSVYYQTEDYKLLHFTCEVKKIFITNPMSTYYQLKDMIITKEYILYCRNKSFLKLFEGAVSHISGFISAVHYSQLSYKTANLFVSKIWGRRFYNTIIKTEYKMIYYVFESVLHPRKEPLTKGDIAILTFETFLYMISLLTLNSTLIIITSISYFGILLLYYIYRKNAYRYKNIKPSIHGLLFIVLCFSSIVSLSEL